MDMPVCVCVPVMCARVVHSMPHRANMLTCQRICVAGAHTAPAIMRLFRYYVCCWAFSGQICSADSVCMRTIVYSSLFSSVLVVVWSHKLIWIFTLVVVYTTAFIPSKFVTQMHYWFVDCYGSCARAQPLKSPSKLVAKLLLTTHTHTHTSTPLLQCVLHESRRW